MADDGPRLTVLTWNVWFDEFERAPRLAAVVDEVRRRTPDLVCLQE